MSKQQRRRQRGEGTLFQRSDGLWVGRVEVGWVNGKRKRKTIYAKTQARAVKRLAQARTAVSRGDHTTSTPTVAQWLTVWLDEVCPAKPRMSPGTLVNYRSLVRKHIVPAIGRIRLDRLAPQHIRALHRAVLASGASATTAGHVHRALGTAMNDAMREGLVIRNVVSLVPKPPADIQERRPLSLDEVRRFFAVIEGDRLASRWHTAFLEGLRQGETLGLRWSLVDLDNAVADVAWQLQRLPWKHGCEDTGDAHRADHCPARVLDLRPGFTHVILEGNTCLQKPKGSKPRMVPLPEPLVATLRDRYERYLAERGNYTVDYDLVWCQPNGRPIRPTRDRQEWRTILERAEIPHTDQHSARHTTATLLLILGVPEHVIMSILGHSQVITTRGYAHADLSLQRGAVAELGSRLFPTQ